MIYIASPYSDPDPAVRQDRYEAAFRFTAALVEKGFVAFSPIVYLHPVALHINSPTDVNRWWDFNITMLRKSEALYLLQLPGWEASEGVDMELRASKIMGLRILYYDADGRWSQQRS